MISGCMWDEKHWVRHRYYRDGHDWVRGVSGTILEAYYVALCGKRATIQAPSGVINDVPGAPPRRVHGKVMGCRRCAGATEKE